MDPVTIGLLASAGIGGISNLFGNDDPELITLEHLKSWGYKPYDTAAEITDIMKLSEQLKKRRRERTSQTLKQKGYDEQTQSYAGEEDILNMTLSAINQAKEKGRMEKSNIANMLMSMNAGTMMQPKESGVSKFVGGALGGTGLALDVIKALNLGGSAAMGGSDTVKKTTTTNTGDEVRDALNLINQPIKTLGDGGTIPLPEGLDRGPMEDITIPGEPTGSNQPGSKLRFLSVYPTSNQIFARKYPEIYKLRKYFS